MTLSFLSHGRTPALDALLLLVVANLSLQPLTEPDFGWHLRAGLDLVAQGGRLPTLDPYSHTMPDWPWVEHAWLTDGLIGWLYGAAGSGGALAVIVLFAAVTAGAWWLAALTSGATSTARFGAMVVSLWVALPFLGARTQLITVFGTALLVWMLRRVGQEDRRVVWYLPPLFLLWANLHGGFTAGWLFLALVVGMSWLVPALTRRWPLLIDRGGEFVVPPTERGPLTAATGVGAAATLINPYGWNLHREIVDSLSDRFMIETLQEWHSVSLETLAGKLFAGYLAALGLAILLWYRRVEPVRWTVLAVFLALACRHLRNIPLFLILSLPLAAQLMEQAMVAASRTAVARLARPAWWRGGGALVLGVCLLALGPNHPQRVWRSGVDPAGYFRGTSYPIEAVEWIRVHRDRVGRRLYHDYGHGGFLLWWLPGEKVFIDGRMPAWRIGDRDIFRDYVALATGSEQATALLDKYGVDWILVKRGSPLTEVVNRLPIWRKEYEDGKVEIYVMARDRPPVVDPSL